MLVQRFDDASGAKDPEIPWYFFHGCHMAAQVIISSFSKGRMQEEQNGGAFLLGKTSFFQEALPDPVGQNGPFPPSREAKKKRHFPSQLCRRASQDSGPGMCVGSINLRFSMGAHRLGFEMFSIYLLFMVHCSR